MGIIFTLICGFNYVSVGSFNPLEIAPISQKELPLNNPPPSALDNNGGKTAAVECSVCNWEC